MKTTAAQTAAAIRTELKAKYPTIKFTVKSENFTGGDSVDVKWVDGPRESEVQSLLKKYEYGHSIQQRVERLP